MQPQQGELSVPDKAGLGLAFDRDVLKRYGVAA